MSTGWYYGIEGRSLGPVSLQELLQELAKRPHPADVWVWRDGFPNWQKAGDVPELDLRPKEGGPPPPPHALPLPPAAPRSLPLGVSPDQSETLPSSADVLRLWFDFKGRANRAKYWLVVLVNLAILFAGVFVGFAISMTFGWIVFSVLIVATIVSSAAVGAKRLHDRDKSAWWLLVIYVVPAILSAAGDAIGGPALLLNLVSIGISLWAFVELGCLRGTEGPNKYGADPLGASSADQRAQSV